MLQLSVTAQFLGCWSALTGVPGTLACVFTLQKPIELSAYDACTSMCVEALIKTGAGEIRNKCKCSLKTSPVILHKDTESGLKTVSQPRATTFCSQQVSPSFCSCPFRLRLLLDDQLLKPDQRLPSFPGSQRSLRLGGSDFEGCISNVFVQRCVPFPCAMPSARGLRTEGVPYWLMESDSHNLKKTSLAQHSH